MDLSALAPGTYFISHAYRDARQVAELVAALPAHVAPLVFEPVPAGPDVVVSDILIPAIQACDGLIYVDSAAAAASSWVTFEVDSALRAGRTVYAYDPVTRALGVSDRPLLDLAVRLSYDRADAARCEQIVRLMRRRSMNLREPGPPFRGGFLVAFWSGAAATGDVARVAAAQGQGRAIVAALDDSPLPPELTRWPGLAVRLVQDGALSPHRIDDLIVTVYWLIRRTSEMGTADRLRGVREARP